MDNLSTFTGELQITYITGPRDGQTEVIKDGILKVKTDTELQLKTLNDKVYIQVPSHEPIFINNREIIGTTEIRNDDIVQIDEGSPLLRVRFTQSAKKSLSQMSSDAKALAKNNKGPTGMLFFYYFLKQLTSYSTKFFRLILTLVILSLLTLAYNQYQYIQGEAEKIEQTSRDIAEKRAAIDKSASALTEEIDTVIEKSSQITNFSTIIDTYARSVGYIDAEIGYKSDDEWITYGDLFDVCEPNTDYDLYPDYYDELRSNETEYYFDVIWYGSGFLVDEDGTVITNRHVAGIEDSIVEEFEYYGCDFYSSDLSDYDFFARVVIIFPGDDAFYTLENIAYHEDYDFAVAHIHNFTLGEKTPLKLSENHMKHEVGSPIITLGYPSGIDFLVYKNSSSDTRSAELNNMVESLSWDNDRTSLLNYILEQDLINTHVTRGIVSQITKEAVSFDSSIYGGNSGGPIITGDGEVIGIVTWKWGENETFNLGVSSKVILDERDDLVEDVL